MAGTAVTVRVAGDNLVCWRVPVLPSGRRYGDRWRRRCRTGHPGRNHVAVRKNRSCRPGDRRCHSLSRKFASGNFRWRGHTHRGPTRTAPAKSMCRSAWRRPVGDIVSTATKTVFNFPPEEAEALIAKAQAQKTRKRRRSRPSSDRWDLSFVDLGGALQQLIFRRVTVCPPPAYSIGFSTGKKH